MQDTKIVEIIKEYILKTKNVNMNENDSFLSFIDSMEFLEMVLFLEEKVGDIDFSDYSPDDFSTPIKMAKILQDIK